FTSWLASRGQAATASAAAHPAGVGANAEASTAEARGPGAKSTAASAAGSSAAAVATTSSISSDRPLTAVVPNVSGAPGDGSTSLASALQRELSSKGISLANKPSTVAYRVEGTVTMGAAKEGKQPIQIEWLVRDPQGKKLGTVSQRNEIPEG